VLFVLGSAGLLSLILPSVTSSATSTVYVLTLDGVINPVSQRYLERGIDRAVTQGATAVVIQLNTHGGLLDPMEKIVEKFLASPIPILVYVAPPGAKADSAGTFITLAGHIAAMAPHTVIGSASAVTLAPGGGEQPEKPEESEKAKEKGEQGGYLSNEEALRRKIMNHALSVMKNIVRVRGRNEQWALEAVRMARNDTAEDALKVGAIDLIAGSLGELLAKVDGRKVKVSTGEVALQTRGATIKPFPMSPTERLLFAISDVNVAYILLILGIYGLIYEFANPGSILPGVAGAICLALGLVSLSNFPITYAGIFLLILGFALLLLEIKMMSHGALAIGGAVCLFFGSLMLVDAQKAGVAVALPLILGTVGATAAFFLFAVGKGLQAQRLKVTTGG